MKNLNILFMCRANCFRSKVAEAYFKKINKNKKIKIKSAGVIDGFIQNKNQINIAKKYKINIKGKPRGITTKLLKWTDILVIVADDVPPIIFNYEKKKKYIKLISLKIRDVKNSKDINENKKVIKEIIKKITQLNTKLEKR